MGFAENYSWQSVEEVEITNWNVGSLHPVVVYFEMTTHL